MISEDKISILQCPTCKGDLSQDGVYLVCVNCDSKFPVIDNVVVFLTKDDVAELMSQPWGAELQKDYEGVFPGFNFASNEDKLEDLQRVFDETREAGCASRWVMTGTFPTDPCLSEELILALDKSKDRLVDLSRAASAKRILDWPTGPGGYMSRMIHSVHTEAVVVALDINFRMLARIKPYYDANGFSGNMLFVAADARKMPFKDGVFHSVTAWGGTVEIGDPEIGFKETLRVLQDEGWFGVTGDQYKEDSPSMEIAEGLGTASLLTKNRLEAAMNLIGFRNLEYEVLYEGYDTDFTEDDDERCPLPARGDWFQSIVASGQK